MKQGKGTAVAPVICSSAQTRAGCEPNGRVQPTPVSVSLFLNMAAFRLGCFSLLSLRRSRVLRFCRGTFQVLCVQLSSEGTRAANKRRHPSGGEGAPAGRPAAGRWNDPLQLNQCGQEHETHPLSVSVNLTRCFWQIKRREFNEIDHGRARECRIDGFASAVAIDHTGIQCQRSPRSNLEQTAIAVFWRRARFTSPFRCQDGRSREKLTTQIVSAGHRTAAKICTAHEAQNAKLLPRNPRARDGTWKSPFRVMPTLHPPSETMFPPSL